MDGSSLVAGVAVRGDLGWRKLEERREEKKLVFGWRLHRMSEDRLVRKVVALLNDCRCWWAGYCGMKRKFGVNEELEVVGLRATRRNCVQDIHEDGWQEKVEGKSNLKWYRLAKDDFGQKKYVMLLSCLAIFMESNFLLLVTKHLIFTCTFPFQNLSFRYVVGIRLFNLAAVRNTVKIYSSWLLPYITIKTSYTSWESLKNL